jgi:hypothetical protein
MSACQVKQLSWECKMVLEAIINSIDYKSSNRLRIEARADASVGPRQVPRSCASTT